MAKGANRGRIRSKFVYYNPARREALLLEQLFHQFSGRFSVSLRLHEGVQNLGFIVDSALKPITSPTDGDHHFIEVPVIAGFGTGAT